MSEKTNKERISVTKCRSILKQTGTGLSDEQIIAIRNYLYDLAQIDYDFFIRNESQETDRVNLVRVLNMNGTSKKEFETNDFRQAA